MPVRLAAALVAVTSVLTGCSMGSALPDPRLTASASNGPLPSPARPATTYALAGGTCWSAERLGSDPQLALSLARTFGMTYFEAAYAIKDRPSFREKVACSQDHAIEIYRVVQVASVAPQLTDYSALMRTGGLDFAHLSAAVLQACMDPTLASAARRSAVASASLQPAPPAGYRTGWAPPTLEQWSRGQRVFACTFISEEPGTLQYAALRTAALPTALRTCIASGARIYVDCARKHDRERIAVLDVSGAVAAGTFPGHGAVRTSAGGNYLQVDAAFYRPLDRACTAYLRAVSTRRELTGVAEIDPEAWPDANGVYAVSCEADAPVTSPSRVTQGSVYNKLGS